MTFTCTTTVPLAAGQSYSGPAGIRHEVMNGIGHPMTVSEIETKR